MGYKTLSSTIHRTSAKKGFFLSSFQSKNLNRYKDKFIKNEDSKRIFTKPNGFKENEL